MRFALLSAITAAAAFAAGVATAQTATDNPGASTASADSGQFVSSSTLGDTSKLKAGDTGVTSNSPVPDTPANRAAYGKPLSHAGRATAPSGD